MFAGTRLLTGEARVRVVYTGGETLYGEIVRSAIHGTHEVTPLQAAIGKLVKSSSSRPSSSAWRLGRCVSIRDTAG